MTTPTVSRLSVLACFAHPDDEGFASGGLLAMLAAGGARVTLVCATNGDVGEISDPSLATPENLWQVRQQELRNAMAITGVNDLRFLNYRDSAGWTEPTTTGIPTLTATPTAIAWSATWPGHRRGQPPTWC